MTVLDTTATYTITPNPIGTESFNVIRTSDGIRLGIIGRDVIDGRIMRSATTLSPTASPGRFAGRYDSVEEAAEAIAATWPTEEAPAPAETADEDIKPADRHGSRPARLVLRTIAADPIQLVICGCGTAAFADEADDLGTRNPDTGTWTCEDCLAVCGTCGTAVPEDEADVHGYASDPETGEWMCEGCYDAPASPRLVGMVPC